MLARVVRDLAMLPGWIHVPVSAISAEDGAHWPCSVSVLVKWVIS